MENKTKNSMEYNSYRHSHALSRIGIYVSNDEEHNLDMNLRMSVRQFQAATRNISFDLERSTSFSTMNNPKISFVCRGYGQDIDGHPNDLKRSILDRIESMFDLLKCNSITLALTVNSTLVVDESNSREDKVCLLWHIPSLMENIIRHIPNAEPFFYPRFYSNVYGNIQVNGCPGNPLWTQDSTKILKHSLYVSWKPTLRKQAHLEPFAGAPISTVLGTSPLAKLSGNKEALRNSVYDGTPFKIARNQIAALENDMSTGVRAEVEFCISFSQHQTTMDQRRRFFLQQLGHCFNYLNENFSIHPRPACDEHETGLARLVRAFPMSVCPAILSIPINAFAEMATPWIRHHREENEVPAIELEKLQIAERLTQIAFSGDYKKLPTGSSYLGLTTNVKEKSAPWVNPARFNFRTNAIDLSGWPTYGNTNVLKFAHHTFMSKSKRSGLSNESILLSSKIASEITFASLRNRQTSHDFTAILSSLVKCFVDLFITEVDQFLAKSLVSIASKYVLPRSLLLLINGIEKGLNDEGPRQGHLTSRDSLRRIFVPLLDVNEIKDDTNVRGFTNTPLTAFDWIKHLMKFVGKDEPTTSNLLFPKAAYSINTFCSENNLEPFVTALFREMRCRRSDIALLPRFKGKSRFGFMAFYEIMFPTGSLSMTDQNNYEFTPLNNLHLERSISVTSTVDPLEAIVFDQIDDIMKNTLFITKVWDLHKKTMEDDNRGPLLIPSDVKQIPPCCLAAVDPYNDEHDQMRVFWAIIASHRQTEGAATGSSIIPRKKKINPPEYYLAGLFYLMYLVKHKPTLCGRFSDSVWQVKISTKLLKLYGLVTVKRERSGPSTIRMNPCGWTRQEFLENIHAARNVAEHIEFLEIFLNNYKGMI